MEKEKLKELLADMSLQEKIDQMLQIMSFFYKEDVETVLTGPGRELGITEKDIEMAGSVLGTYGAEALIEIQKDYMEHQPHHIPLLFMMDVIHGMKTIFPAPLGQGAMFEPELAGKCAAAAAKEASVSGLHVVFSPMVDLVRDARWGRIVESTGEDPYLNSCYAAAQVKGLQGEDMKEQFKLCACVKHFAAYGGAEAGRDYNTVELSEHTLRDFYLPSYQAGIDAGAGMVMTSFNTINGIPASTNKWLMKDILRKEMGFEGVLISDFSAIQETISHGYSEDSYNAAKKALEAGVDIDMMTGSYAGNLQKLVQDGEVQESMIDESVMRILELKNELGLFENPFKDADPQKETELLLCEEHRKLAREAAGKSFVLLKNEGILPLDTTKKIAFIGPYTDNKEISSSWAVTGDIENNVSLGEAARNILGSAKTLYCQGSPVLDNEDKLTGTQGIVEHYIPSEEQENMLKDAVAAAREADIVVMPLGEHYQQSGEAASRAMIDIPAVQMRLFREVAKVNPNIVTVLFSGRPLDIRELAQTSRAILQVWLPGTEGGNAIIDVLTGKVNPSGKLSVSFPYCVGQIPVYYNAYSTGRPVSEQNEERYKSRYLDIPNEPLYPFGYGLSYTSFEISPVILNTDLVTDDTSILASVKVKNIGTATGTEVIQMYIQDVAASVVRPVKELKGFKRVMLEPGEEKEIEFVIDEPMLRFTCEDGRWASETGNFRVWIGNSSLTENKAEFRYGL